MRKTIKGKRYDTDTAQRLAQGGPETLYITKSGQYFVHSVREWGEDIKPVSFEAASAWAEKNLSQEVYATLFGAEEHFTNVTIRLTLDEKNRLQASAQARGVSMNRVLADFIRSLPPSE